MSPSILVVGATGNTGVGVVDTLVDLIPKSSRFASHAIIALTRDASGASAKAISDKHSAVQVVEKDWLTIDAAWLKERGVERLFVAPQSGPTHFTDESLFLNEALRANVEYVVRISTTTCNVKPDAPAFYTRNHWAVEAMLETPAFDAMHWSSLQPNLFTSLVTTPLLGWLDKYRKEGKKDTLRIMIDADHPIALIDPREVGIVAGHLLVTEDVTKHDKQKYTLVGPSDVTGRDAVDLLEKHAGTKVEDVVFRDNDTNVNAAIAGGIRKVLAETLKYALVPSYDGGNSTKATPTSPQVLELYELHVGAHETWDKALAGAATSGK